MAVQSFEPLTVPAGKPFSFTLPAQTFQHAEPAASIQISAQSANGQKLPDWLRFDPVSRRFEGTPPPGMQQLEVSITATGPDGQTASTTIVLQFTPS